MSEAMRLKYIGAISLLGRMAKHVRDDDQQLYCIEAAVADFLESEPGFYSFKGADGTICVEPKPQSKLRRRCC